MSSLPLAVFAIIQIILSLMTSDSGVYGTQYANISGADYSGEQQFSDTSLSSFSCPCPRHLTINTLGYSPCSVYNYISPRECDAYIEVALIQAFSDLLWRVDLPLFSNFCFAPLPFEEDRADLPRTIGFPYFYRNSPMLHMHGIIGPSDIYVSEIFNYISAMTLKKLSVSYSASNALLEDHDKYPFFFATTTKPSFINTARLKLLSDFHWRRVAVVATDDSQNSKSAEAFMEQALTNLSLHIYFPSTFHDDPTALLKDYKNDDYRIFMGFFHSNVSRKIICKAYKLGLTTHNHVWILPGIYDYRWWRDCSCDSRSKCGCECTEEEMNEAIQGMIFIDTSHLHHFESETYSIQEQYDKLIYIFNDARLLGIYRGINIEEEDKQYLIHSQAFNAYDAATVWANVWHKAVEQLLNSSLFNDNDSFCNYLTAPVDWLSDETDILNDIMIEILEESFFCGRSGFYTFSKKNDKDNFGQIMITQLQHDRECYIGIYKNYNSSDSECVVEELQPLRQSLFLDSSSSLVFVNYTEFNITDNNFSYPCPYRWKGENGMLVSWKPPTDGACYDESCLCYNQLGVLEIALTSFIVTVGIVVSIVLLIINTAMRSNKHIKASSPKFNMLVIMGSFVMYPAALFTALSYSGTLIGNVNIRQKAIPAFCEITKWLSYSGMIIILSTIFARNWRIYKIFYNPRIEERNYLSDKNLVLIIICLTIPVIILLVIWTGVHPYEYYESRILYNCPNIIVDDSIKTYLVTITGSSEKWWDGILIGYNFLLSFGLMFLSLQNAKITTHFAQEGEFIARVVFVIFLLLVPLFLIKILLLLTSDNRFPIVWFDLIFIVSLPTIILGGLFIPKFILILKEYKTLKREEISPEMTLLHQKQLEQIASLKSMLEQSQCTITMIREGSIFTRIEQVDQKDVIVQVTCN